ncbi:MAG: ATP-binding protein [Pseudomonadota bacterium]
MTSATADHAERRDVLSEYLSQFETVADEHPADDPDRIDQLIQRWADPACPNFSATRADGKAQLLTSKTEPNGGTVFLSIGESDRQERHRLATYVLENHPLPIWANETATGRLLYSNSAASWIYGDPDQSLEDQKIADFLSGPEASINLLDELRQSGTIDDYDIQMKNDVGEEVWVRACGALAEFDGTEIVIGSVQNITDGKKVEEENRAALGVLRDAIESLTEGFALYDNDHKLVIFNQSYKDMNGLVADILEPGLPYEMMLRQMVRRGGYADAIGREDEWVAERLENAVLYAKGDEVNHSNGKSYQVSIHPTKFGGFVVTRTDITERKQAEAQERDQDLLVRTVLDASSSIVIMARTGDGEILYRSPAAHEMFGNTKSAREHYVNPEDRADFVTQMLSDGQIDDYRLDVNARGRIIPAALSARFAEYRGEEVIVTSVIDLTQHVKAQAMIRQVLESCPVPLQMTKAKTGETLFRSPETVELFGECNDAKTYYVDPSERNSYLEEMRENGFVRNRKAKYLNAAGEQFWGSASAKIINFDGDEIVVSSTRDLTEEIAIQDELVNQRELLFQNEKMSALGELLAGVAHELNNPLSIVVGHSLMLQEEVDDPNLLKRIEKIGNAAERSAKIVKTFLAMARQKPAKMESLDIGSVVATAIDVAGYGHQSDGLKIVSDVSDNLPHVQADADQITQVIINLVINSAHAIKKAQTGDRIEVKAFADKHNETLEITVSDNGPGIPENIKARIFEPFFTTKEVGDGTGIGLAFCHRIIHSHGGQIRLSSKQSEGSTFCISLPISAETLDELESEATTDQRSGSKKILVVDDERDVGELVAEVLIREGFDVDVVHSGSQALNCLAAASYDVVLSDLNMPDVDGRGLYETVGRDFPSMSNRLGFITGDTMGEASQRLLQESQRPFLEKPVSPREVRDLVYGILEDVKDAG